MRAFERVIPRVARASDVVVAIGSAMGNVRSAGREARADHSDFWWVLLTDPREESTRDLGTLFHQRGRHDRGIQGPIRTRLLPAATPDQPPAWTVCPASSGRPVPEPDRLGNRRRAASGIWSPPHSEQLTPDNATPHSRTGDDVVGRGWGDRRNHRRSLSDARSHVSCDESNGLEAERCRKRRDAAGPRRMK